MKRINFLSAVLAIAVAVSTSAFTSSAMDEYVLTENGFELKSSALSHGDCIEQVAAHCTYILKPGRPANSQDPADYDEVPNENAIWVEN